MPYFINRTLRASVKSQLFVFVEKNKKLILKSRMENLDGEWDGKAERTSGQMLGKCLAEKAIHTASKNMAL